MWALVVVVADVLAKDFFEVVPPEHQGPIQALRPYVWVPNTYPTRSRYEPVLVNEAAEDLGPS